MTVVPRDCGVGPVVVSLPRRLYEWMNTLLMNACAKSSHPLPPPLLYLTMLSQLPLWTSAARRPIDRFGKPKEPVDC